MSQDGDPIDVMCVGNRPLVPGAVLRVRPVGVLLMKDDKGEDEKILAVPHRKISSYYDRIDSYTDLPDLLIQKIQHFFEHYKDLEPSKWADVVGWAGVDKARELIREAVERAKAEPVG